MHAQTNSRDDSEFSSRRFKQDGQDSALQLLCKVGYIYRKNATDGNTALFTLHNHNAKLKRRTRVLQPELKRQWKVKETTDVNVSTQG